jgi:hypothetical protein
VQEKYLRWVVGVDRETPHSEGRVQKEETGWKGRVQDIDGMLEKKEKERGRRRERNTTRGTGMPVKKWKD